MSDPLLPRACRWPPLLVSIFLLAVAAGCAGLRGGSSHGIGEVHLFGLPVALTAPGSSTPIGIGVRIYASEAGGSHGLPIGHGRLEVLMFDQAPAGLNPQTQKPLKTWSFPAADLAAFRVTTMLGTCYQLELKWDQDHPKGKVITVVARYGISETAQILSPPTVIALTTQ